MKPSKAALTPPRWLNRIRVCLGVALSLLAAATARADEARWERHLASANEAFNSGKLDEAEAIGQQLVEEAVESFPGNDPRIGESWNNLGLIQRRAEKFGAAKESFQKAIDAYDASLKPGDVRLQNAWFNMGQVAYSLRQYDQSLAAVSRSLAVAENRLGPSDLQLVPILQELAGHAISAGKNDEAIAAGRRAIDLAGAASGEESPPAAEAVEYLGNILLTLEHFSEAEATFMQALAIREKTSRKCDPELLSVLVNLYLCQSKAGRSDEAQATLTMAIGKSETRLGIDSPDLRPLLRLQLDSLDLQRQTDEAAAVEQRLKRLDEIGTWSEQLADAQQLRGQNKLDEAAAALGVVASAASELGESDFIAGLLATEQGELAYAKKQLSESEEHFARALELSENVHGKHHVAVAAAQMRLGIVRAFLGQTAESVRCYEQGLAACREAPTTDKEVLANLLTMLGMVYFNAKRHAEAEPLLFELVSLRKEIRPDEEPETAKFWNFLGIACLNQGKLADAQACFNIAGVLLDRHVPSEHPLRRDVASNASVVEEQLAQTSVAASLGEVNSPNAASLLDPKAIVTGGIGAAVLAIFVASKAGRRGYNSLTWFVTFFIFENPIIMLAILAILPDRNLEKLRKKERQRIAQLLDQRQSPAMVAASGNGLTSESVGDQVTSISG